MKNIIDLPVITRLDRAASDVLEEASRSDLREVVVIATTKDGDLYFNSSIASGPNVLWLMELVKKELMA